LSDRASQRTVHLRISSTKQCFFGLPNSTPRASPSTLFETQGQLPDSCYCTVLQTRPVEVLQVASVLISRKRMEIIEAVLLGDLGQQLFLTRLLVFFFFFFFFCNPMLEEIFVTVYFIQNNYINM
jgi:hypothetical protein